MMDARRYSEKQENILYVSPLEDLQFFPSRSSVFAKCLLAI